MLVSVCCGCTGVVWVQVWRGNRCGYRRGYRCGYRRGCRCGHMRVVGTGVGIGVSSVQVWVLGTGRVMKCIA